MRGDAESLKRAIKIWIVVFIAALALSGITAFALETELAWLNHLSFLILCCAILLNWFSITTSVL